MIHLETPRGYDYQESPLCRVIQTSPWGSKKHHSGVGVFASDGESQHLITASHIITPQSQQELRIKLDLSGRDLPTSITIKPHRLSELPSEQKKIAQEYYGQYPVSREYLYRDIASAQLHNYPPPRAAALTCADEFQPGTQAKLLTLDPQTHEPLTIPGQLSKWADPGTIFGFTSEHILQPGMSGGAVIKLDGTLLGIITTTQLPELNDFAIAESLFKTIEGPNNQIQELIQTTQDNMAIIAEHYIPVFR